MKKIFKIFAFILISTAAMALLSCNSEQPEATEGATSTDEVTEATEATEKATKKPKETEPLTKLENTEGLDLNLKILSQNVRYADDDSGTVAQRTTRLRALIEEHQPDLIGTQEVTFEWYMYLRTLKEYAIVGCSRNGRGESTGEWSAIMYKKDRFVLLDSDTFWLTETPDEVSMTEGAKCRRICTWAELFDRYTGETVIMTNTHLDHSTDAVREIQARYLIEHLKTRLGEKFESCAVYLTGDFNCKNTTTPYDAIIEGGFADSRKAALEDLSTVAGSYHGYENKDREIDFCFFNSDETVLSYEIISKGYAGDDDTEPGYVSDHYGVLATFKREG